MEKDFYSILGLTEEDKKLPKDKFQKKLKSKWHELSMRYHPDRNQGSKEAEEKFKKISEAYDTLSDGNKRQEYDIKQSGFGGFSNSFGFNGGFGDFFEDMMGGFGFHQQQRPRVVRGEDLNINVNITLEDVLNGATKTFKFVKLSTCDKCNGTGSKDGKSTVCPHCGGSGRVRNVMRNGNQQIIQETVCPNCHGTGHIITNKCNECGGTGVKRETITKTITIPKGIFEGAYMTFPNEGNAPANANGNGVNGELNISFHILPHSEYSVDGQNLKQDIKLNLYEAWHGCTKEVKCLDGTIVKVKIPSLTENFKLFQVKGKGLPNVNNPSSFGTLILRAVYQMPKKELTDKQLDLLKEFYEIENARNKK